MAPQSKKPRTKPISASTKASNVENKAQRQSKSSNTAQDDENRAQHIQGLNKRDSAAPGSGRDARPGKRSL